MLIGKVSLKSPNSSIKASDGNKFSEAYYREMTEENIANAGLVRHLDVVEVETIKWEDIPKDEQIFFGDIQVKPVFGKKPFVVKRQIAKKATETPLDAAQRARAAKDKMGDAQTTPPAEDKTPATAGAKTKGNK